MIIAMNDVFACRKEILYGRIVFSVDIGNCTSFASWQLVLVLFVSLANEMVSRYCSFGSAGYIRYLFRHRR